jgi:uncharacterized membrane protein YdbT with pleckstrin-like domain
MSYIEHSLGQSESLRYRAHFPWFYGGSGWALLFVSAILAAVAEWSGYGLLAVAFLLAGLSLLLLIMVPIWTTEIGVTDQRFIFKRGLLWRSTQELQLRAIEEVNLEQGLLGRLFDFGRLELRGTGVDDISLPSIAEPLELRKALQDGMAAATQPGVAAAPIPIQPHHVEPPSAR